MEKITGISINSSVLLLEVQWIRDCQEKMIKEVETLTRPRDKNISRRIIMVRRFRAISTGPQASAITWSAQTAADLLWEYICRRDLTRNRFNILSEILRCVLSRNKMVRFLLIWCKEALLYYEDIGNC